MDMKRLAQREVYRDKINNFNRPTDPMGSRLWTMVFGADSKMDEER
jgi:hypothetical protein